MDTTYIILDGSNASLSTDGNNMTWQLNDDFFKKLESDERFMFQLVSAQFLGNLLGLISAYKMNSEIYANIKSFNVSETLKTNGYSLIGVVDSYINSVTFVDELSNTYTYNTVSEVERQYNHPVYITNKFNEISIFINFNNNMLDFRNIADIGLNKKLCKFMFKLTKIKV